MAAERRSFLPVLLLVLLAAIAGGIFYMWRLQDARQRNDSLVKAANDGNLTRVQELLAAGADANARGSQINTETALMRAAANGQADVVRVLLDHGAEVNARHEGEGDLHGRTALFFAVGSRQDVPTIELLLARGADAGLKDRSGKSALRLALDNENAEVAELLKKAGAKE
jgi:ankyrin repeat protein